MTWISEHIAKLTGLMPRPWRWQWRSRLKNRDLRANLAFVLAVTSIIAGIWWMHPPTALIVLGLFLLIPAVAWSRPTSPTQY